MKVNINETSILSVSELATDANYVWELYDQIPTDFAKTTGNCPTKKAEFIGGNKGYNVKVKWLKSGVYFYKVTTNLSCTNNLKIGKVVVKPEKPKINIYYNCEDGIAELTATDYTGSLTWNTSEKSEKIIVNKEGVYTLYQTINGVDSDPIEVSIQNPKVISPDLSDNVTTLQLDEEVTLMASGCENGEIIWYSNPELTKKVDITSFHIKKDITYYAVCITDQGCQSEASKLVLIVNYDKDDCSVAYNNLKGNLTNLISPNGDGINDTWELQKLAEYCEKCNKKAHIEIFNRWGNTVYKSSDYFNSNNKFSGRTFGAHLVLKPNENLPTGTYFYIINIEGKEPLKGWIYINN